MDLKRNVNCRRIEVDALEKRQIALIHDDLNSCGGAERLAISTIEALNSNNYEVSLITCTRTNWNRIQSFFGKHIRVEREYCLPLNFQITETYGSIPLILYKLKTRQGRTLMFNTKGDTIPAIYDNVTYIHELYVVDENESFNTLPWRLYFAPRKLTYKALCKPRIILTNSFFSKRRISAILGKEAEVVYPPIDLKNYKELLNYESSRRNIVSVCSRFSLEKRLDLVPKIAALIEGKFFVMGSTERTSRPIISHIRKEIRRMGLEEKIVLCPNISHKEKLRILSRSKVFLHLKPYEHFGMAIVEAMAAGCIPVVPDSGGPKEFVPRRWRYKDTEEAADKIRQAFDLWSRAEAEKISKITDRFDEVHYQRRVLDIIDEIA